MAQLLSILARSTKAMTAGRISMFFDSLCPCLAENGSEKAMKRLAGKTDVEDALSRLDMLTREENLAGIAQSLESTYRFFCPPSCVYLRFPHCVPISAI
jgi:hypothetical protein